MNRAGWRGQRECGEQVLRARVRRAGVQRARVQRARVRRARASGVVGMESDSGGGEQDWIARTGCNSNITCTVWRENLDLDKNFKFRVSNFTKKAKKEFRL